MTGGPAANGPVGGRYYVLEPSFWPGGGFPRIDFANEARLFAPGTVFIAPPTGAPDQYPERPRLVHQPRRGPRHGLPRDFEEVDSLWIVSAALKAVFEAVDPTGFAFAACDFVLSDGRDGPPLFLAHARREIDALDEEASRLKIKRGEYVNGKYYSRAGGASLVFRPDVVGTAHVFRTPFSPMVICDRMLHDALRAAKLKGVSLRDARAC